MANVHTENIDAAIRRLVDQRRLLMPLVAIDPSAIDQLMKIQGALVDLVRARDQENALASTKRKGLEAFAPFV
ncbi:hypothetical protein MRS76_09800 [Rhizobiaceae bacterium n13]|uniref:Uncharacterized protein n=1 Tax=Ferirhizobium litorale TaxID=2927786 RepID=A0AAE3QFY7_9HYPH|nr:hypothetical protein [Fererhizobium litorale]MDI7862252.1 hypothetical protein [Fererhizobium litorale]MDI7922474.1 hypothetical protein [Fererhizobium litorale]